MFSTLCPLNEFCVWHHLQPIDIPVVTGLKTDYAPLKADVKAKPFFFWFLS